MKTSETATAANDSAMQQQEGASTGNLKVQETNKFSTCLAALSPENSDTAPSEDSLKRVSLWVDEKDAQAKSESETPPSPKRQKVKPKNEAVAQGLNDLVRLLQEGFALTFVEKLKASYAKMKECMDPMVVAEFHLASDELLCKAECLYQLQDENEKKGISTIVDIAYHWTKTKYIESIDQHGLLTSEDRRGKRINSRKNGSKYGDGVYSCWNPFSHHERGDTCIILARLQGKTERVRSDQEEYSQKTGTVDEKFRSRGFAVVRASQQCVPLVRFNKSLLDTSNDRTSGNQALRLCHRRLHKLVDDCFNSHKTSCLEPFLLCHLHEESSASTSALESDVEASVCTDAACWADKKFNCCACDDGVPVPTVTNKENLDTEWIVYQAPDTLIDRRTAYFATVDATSVPDTECPVCLSSLNNSLFDGAVSLQICGHWFHTGCIQSALEHGDRCPVCRALFNTPQGKMPYGSMVITRSPNDTCEGHSPGTINIDYNMHSGVQRAYHENPGQAYPSTSRRAYLPDNASGNRLIKRLKFAFRCGLTFTVGTSLTTGRHSVITWSSIHHKTNRCSGLHGYPDDSFFYNCNEELDALGVPAAEDCPDSEESSS